MKKIIAVVLSLVMVLCLAACAEKANGETTGANQENILSKYPKDINEWTAENFNSYFKEVGVYTEDKWIYVQDHASYYAGTAVDTCGGYMDDQGLYFTGVFIIDPNSQEADGKAMLDHIRTNKTFTEDLSSLPVDHLAGNVAFFYSFSADEAFFNKFDTAVNQLFADLGVTPDF